MRGWRATSKQVKSAINDKRKCFSRICMGLLKFLSPHETIFEEKRRKMCKDHEFWWLRKSERMVVSPFLILALLLYVSSSPTEASSVKKDLLRPQRNHLLDVYVHKLFLPKNGKTPGLAGGKLVSAKKLFDGVVNASAKDLWGESEILGKIKPALVCDGDCGESSPQLARPPPGDSYRSSGEWFERISSKSNRMSQAFPQQDLMATESRMSGRARHVICKPQFRRRQKRVKRASIEREKVSDTKKKSGSAPGNQLGTLRIFKYVLTPEDLKNHRLAMNSTSNWTDTSREFSMEVTKALSKEDSKDFSKELSKSFSKESSKDFSKELSKDFSKESPKDFSKELTKDFSKELTKDISKELTKDFSKELTKDFSKELTKDFSKELTKGFSKVSHYISREFSKDISKEFSKAFSERKLSPDIRGKSNFKISFKNTKVSRNAKPEDGKNGTNPENLEATVRDKTSWEEIDKAEKFTPTDRKVLRTNSKDPEVKKVFNPFRNSWDEENQSGRRWEENVGGKFWADKDTSGSRKSTEELQKDKFNPQRLRQWNPAHQLKKLFVGGSPLLDQNYRYGDTPVNTKVLNPPSRPTSTRIRFPVGNVKRAERPKIQPTTTLSSASTEDYSRRRASGKKSWIRSTTLDSSSNESSNNDPFSSTTPLGTIPSWRHSPPRSSVEVRAEIYPSTRGRMKMGKKPKLAMTTPRNKGTIPPWQHPSPLKPGISGSTEIPGYQSITRQKSSTLGPQMTPSVPKTSALAKFGSLLKKVTPNPGFGQFKRGINEVKPSNMGTRMRVIPKPLSRPADFKPSVPIPYPSPSTTGRLVPSSTVRMVPSTTDRTVPTTTGRAYSPQNPEANIDLQGSLQYRYPKNANSIQDIVNYFKSQEPSGGNTITSSMAYPPRSAVLESSQEIMIADNTRTRSRYAENVRPSSSTRRRTQPVSKRYHSPESDDEEEVEDAGHRSRLKSKPVQVSREDSDGKERRRIHRDPDEDASYDYDQNYERKRDKRPSTRKHPAREPEEDSLEEFYDCNNNRREAHDREVSIERPISKSSYRPISRSSERPISRSSERPISRSSERPISRSPERPISRSSERPISRSSDRPSSSRRTPSRSPSTTNSPDRDDYIRTKDRRHRQRGQSSTKSFRDRDDYDYEEDMDSDRTPHRESSEPSETQRQEESQSMEQAYYQQRNRPIVIKKPYGPYRPVDIKKVEEKRREQDQYWNSVDSKTSQGTKSAPTYYPPPTTLQKHYHYYTAPKGIDKPPKRSQPEMAAIVGSKFGVSPMPHHRMSPMRPNLDGGVTQFLPGIHPFAQENPTDRAKREKLMRMYRYYKYRNDLEQAQKDAKTLTTPAPAPPTPIRPMRMKIHIYPNNHVQMVDQLTNQHQSFFLAPNPVPPAPFYPPVTTKVVHHHPPSYVEHRHDFHMSPPPSPPGMPRHPTMYHHSPGPYPGAPYGGPPPPHAHPYVMKRMGKSLPANGSKGAGNNGGNKGSKKNLVVHLHVHSKEEQGGGLGGPRSIGMDDTLMAPSNVVFSTGKSIKKASNTKEKRPEDDAMTMLRIKAKSSKRSRRASFEASESGQLSSERDYKTKIHYKHTPSHLRSKSSGRSSGVTSLSMEVPIPDTKLKNVLSTLLKFRE